jgi:hypothetical protein
MEIHLPANDENRVHRIFEVGDFAVNTVLTELHRAKESNTRK